MRVAPFEVVWCWDSVLGFFGVDAKNSKTQENLYLSVLSPISLWSTCHICSTSSSRVYELLIECLIVGWGSFKSMVEGRILNQERDMEGEVQFLFFPS